MERRSVIGTVAPQFTLDCKTLDVETIPKIYGELYSKASSL